MSTARHHLVQWTIRAAEAAAARQERSRRAPSPAEIAVVTGYTENLAAMGEIAAANRRAYAARHGYALQVHTADFDPSRPASWSKIRFLQSALREHRCALWSDADALIMNGNVAIPSLLPAGTDVVLTETTVPFPHINAGSMLFRSTVFSRLFLTLVWRLTPFVHDPSWEQRAINHLVASYRFRRLRVLPNRRLNAFAHVPNDPDPYQAGDFIVHFPGVPDRRSLMQSYATQSAKAAASSSS